MKLKTLSLFGAGLIGAGLINLANAVQTPNYYECAGRGAYLTLTIGTGGLGIAPVETKLDLMLHDMNYSFDRESITTESTVIGELWEVALEQIPDLYTKTATVVIPRIALDMDAVMFRTKLILTRTNTPLSPDTLEGVVNPSRYMNLNCTASLLYY